VPGDERLPDAIAGTMATVFPSVYRWRAGDFNEIVVGFTKAVSIDELERRIRAVPPGLEDVAGRARSAQQVAPSADPLTDDRAPVEWMTDQMIVRYAADGGTGR
jgi:hypothetical protein